MIAKFATLAALVAGAAAQNVCSLTAETHPSMKWSKCTSGGSCTNVQGSITIDANWRWTHQTSAATNCYDGNTWDTSYCNDGVSCASKCCVDGAEYTNTYGITTSGDSLNLKFVTKGQYSTNIGSRTYLMESDTKYQMFELLGNEFTFDVDVSNLGCGLNGALYFVSMDADGGLSKYSGNKAGAKYGTGYCDAQCPRDLKFINGEANVEGWVSSTNDPNAGSGKYGSCCSEMDIWEANNMATAFTPHPCTEIGQTRCEGDGCGGTYSSDRYAGVCDPDGCDFNSYRQGNKTFYGKGKTVDTTKKVTVVTQFYKNAAGELSEIKRFYAQNGVIIPNSESTISGNPGNSITQGWCDAQKAAFGDEGDFNRKGGMVQMGKALAKPMVLVMSVWDDHAVNMLWLDSTFPTDKSGPGIERGECPTSSGVPAEVEAQVPNSNVMFSNIRFGPIGSTVAGLPNGGTTNPGSSSSATVPSSTAKPTSTSTIKSTSTSSATTVPTGGAKAPHWGQCGGKSWTGPTVCESPYTCKVTNEWYSQCL
ncbi:glycoside hydrolase family 7 protein [Parachaetomium inaequale]|uniref:Glucanase n=1 Tax=Parachaetomium inaequale TaxID=2588326 RepID=A0AAN6P941_9PEZI|nr:glycoside hydrolase family 7 protein [Parachaetomium inaequale]